VKKCLWMMVLCLVLTIACGGEGFAQAKKELTISSTSYLSGTPKVTQVDPDRSIGQVDLLGWKVVESGDAPFHGAQMHVLGVLYNSKGYIGFRGYGTWIDKDGDKLIWELLDRPPGASSSPARLIAGTGKYMGWQGTMEYTTTPVSKPYPQGTVRLITRDVIKIVISE